MRFTATAEHTAGESVSHPCRKGIYSDPTDDFQWDVTAIDYDAAVRVASRTLYRIAESAAACDCHRKLSPGSDSWIGSVAVNLWPQDAEAFESWRQHFGDLPGDIIPDPYNLIPAELKAADNAAV